MSAAAPAPDRFRTTSTLALIALIGSATALISVLLSRFLIPVIVGLIVRSSVSSPSEDLVLAAVIPMVLLFATGFLGGLLAVVLDVVLIIRGPGRIRVLAGIALALQLFGGLTFAATMGVSSELAPTVANNLAEATGMLIAAALFLLVPPAIAALLNAMAWKLPQPPAR